MPKMMLTVEEVATLLRVSTQTVRKYIRDKKIPATKLGKQHLIPEGAIADLLSGGNPHE